MKNKKKQIVSFLTISTSFIIFFFVALIISKLFPSYIPINIEELLKTYAVDPTGFAPEPQERWIYIANTLLTPILCGGLYLFFTRQIKREKYAKIKLLFWILQPVFLYSIGYLAFLGLTFSAFNYLKPGGLIQHPWITFVINLGLIVFLFSKQNHKKNNKITHLKWLGIVLYWGLGCAILFLIGFETIFNEAEFYVPHIHFVAYFDSVAQVLLGKHIFVDFYPQYGSYAWLLKPIFQVFGLNVLNFTITMGVLKVITYGSFLVLFYKLLDNKLIAFLSFATMFFYTRMRGPIDILTDPYFQYTPHRMIFPVIFVLLAWFYISSNNLRTKRLAYFINSLLSAIATLWNPDTGLVVTLAWAGILIYQELYSFPKNKLPGTFFYLFRHVSVLLVAYGIVFGSFMASTYLETGSYPNFANSMEHTQFFYFSGYYMMPMPIIHPWNMVVLAYLVGIYFPIRDLMKANQSPAKETDRMLAYSHQQNEFILITSLVGIGLFNYYVGRSHDYNLVATIWPAYIVLAIYIGNLFKRIAPIFRSALFDWKVKLSLVLKNSFQVGLLLGLVYFLGSSFVSIPVNLPAYLKLIQTRVTQVQQGTPPGFSKNAQFIQETSTQNEPVFIISDYAPEMYLYTQHAMPINIAGFGEIILRKDVEKMQSFLKDPPPDAKIYWDKRFYDVNQQESYNIDPYNFLNLVPKEVSFDKNLVLFVDRR